MKKSSPCSRRHKSLHSCNIVCFTKSFLLEHPIYYCLEITVIANESRILRRIQAEAPLTETVRRLWHWRRILWKKQLEALANNKITPCELLLNSTQRLFKKPSRNFNPCFSIKTLKISLLEKMLRGFQACVQLHPIPAEILSTLWIDSTVVL